MMQEKYITVQEVVTAIGGVVWGNANEKIYRIALPVDSALGDLTYFDKKTNPKKIMDTKFSACMVPMELAGKDGRTYILYSEDLYSILDKLVNFFAGTDMYSFSYDTEPDIADTVVIGRYTVIGNGTDIDEETYIGNHVCIGEGVRIGSGCYIADHVTIGDRVVIGDNVYVQPGCVIGADSFEHAQRYGEYHRMKNLGTVIIEDEVDVGANTTIARGIVGDTMIRSGTIIDNLVQIGHDVRVGSNCRICAQCGIAGWAVIEDYVILYGKVGVSNYVHVREETTALGMSGITKHTKQGQVLFGVPARENAIYLKEQAILRKMIKERGK